MPNVSTDALETIVAQIFAAAGLSGQQCDAMAAVLVAGERDGCTSHGLYRVDGCLRTIKAGKVVLDALPRIVEAQGPLVRVDAGGAFSNAAFATGLPALIDAARTHGFAAMVINDCTHFAALWPEVEAIAEAGLASIAMCPSYSTVAPAGGTKALLGTNPFAFGWPRHGGMPYVFDFATSVVARGEIELHRRAGEPLPEGWALDAAGQPTTDPDAALAGAMLPFGGHKGSALSTMIELMAGVMIGDLTSRGALDRLGDTRYAPNHGELVLAFDPQRLSGGRMGDPLANAEALFGGIADQGARLPSQRRHAARARSLEHGIAVTDEQMAHLAALRANPLDLV